MHWRFVQNPDVRGPRNQHRKHNDSEQSRALRHCSIAHESKVTVEFAPPHSV